MLRRYTLVKQHDQSDCGAAALATVALHHGRTVGLQQARALPAIVHVHTDEGLGHFIVLHRHAKNAVIVADPARGVMRMSRAEFCKRWTGYLLALVPNAQRPTPRTGGRPVGSWGRFLGLLRPHRGLVVEAFL